MLQFMGLQRGGHDLVTNNSNYTYMCVCVCVYIYIYIYIALCHAMEEGMATHASILAWRIPMDRGASTRL